MIAFGLRSLVSPASIGSKNASPQGDSHSPKCPIFPSWRSVATPKDHRHNPMSNQALID
jgi:hypothetical protein